MSERTHNMPGPRLGSDISLPQQLRGMTVPFAPEGEAAAAPSAEAPAPAPDNFASQEVADIFTFDPFAADAPAAPTAPTPPAQEPPTGAAPEIPPAQPAPTPASVSDQTLRELTAVQTRLVEQMAQGQQGQQGQQPPQPDAPFADVRVPPELVNALRSEDPAEASTAVNLLVQGAATMAYRKAMEQVTGFISEGLPRMMVQFQQQASTSKQVETDFYGKYPQFNKPELKPAIANVAMSLMQELQAKGQFTGWNESFRDLVAERVLAAFSGIVPAPNAAPAPTQFQPNGSARPAPAPANEILDTLFG